MKKKVRKFPWAVVGYLLALLFFSYVGYSVWYYYANYENVEEFEVCYADRCIKAYHTHFTLLVDICGERLHLPLEHGPLDNMHTHKEANYLHFHERIEYDPATGKLFDESPFILKTTMDIFDIRFNGSCLGKYCNGDVCPSGKPGRVSMTVNGEPSNAFESYRWHDEDVVRVKFE
ncbi:hypothetical protein C4580_02935 [Candidatus Woesearchaeota archaeon]|nr:MAG: hypothetical protein C4580_02935 [Candidatus Woesearchaeota archaeon]